MVGSTVHHYRVRRRLGAGGMGEVYLAEDTRLGRDVALKFLSAAAQHDPERRARFLTEARAASSLRSSNIAAIYDIGHHEGADYLVMEYVEGELLSARISRAPLRAREAVDIAAQVADALAEAHSKGVIHRDIKSANIMVTARGHVKVLDFGLAKFVSPPHAEPSGDGSTMARNTVAGAVLGTVSYMSPEQALGRPIDHRSDLFSLGIVFYEMLAGRLPFEGRTFGEVVDAILHQIPQPAGRYSNEVTPEIEGILRKALEKNPERRYQDARALEIDLHHVREALDEVARHGGTVLRRSSSASHAGAAPPSNTIAVITFANITREPSDEWIGSGIAETVTADLKNVPGVTVIGRERVFDALRNLDPGDRGGTDERFTIDIGRDLGARWIVSGAYQRLGERIRITARFVEVDTGEVLRNVKIDGQMADIFALQDRIVFELTQGLHLELEPSAISEIRRPETRSVEAYELFSRGMLSLRMATADGPDRAINLFERALAIDPEYAEAWAGLGGAYQIKGTFLGLAEQLDRAIEYEKKALSLDPRLADAHVWLGAAYFALKRLDEAAAALQEAIRLDPDHARAHATLARVYWVGQGRIADGIAELERAVEINPQFGYAHQQLAYLYTEQDDWKHAERAARRAIELQELYVSGEEGFLVIGAHTRLGYAYYRQGRYEEALKEYQTELVFLSASDHVLKERSLIELHQKLGAALLRLGQEQEGRRHLRLAIRKYEERVARGAVEAATQYYVACAYALLDDAEQAVRLLESVLAPGQVLNRRRAARDPDLGSLRPALTALGLLDAEPSMA